MILDMNEILSFPPKFLNQNVDFVKLTNIQYTQENVQVRRILGNYIRALCPFLDFLAGIF